MSIKFKKIKPIAIPIMEVPAELPKATNKEVCKEFLKGNKEDNCVITLYIPNELKEGLVELANKDDRTLSGYLRKVLVSHVDSSKVK